MTTTQPHEIVAFLGDDWTAEQIAQITETYLAWERTDGAHLPEDERTQVLGAIAQQAAGVLDIDQLGQADSAAQRAAADARGILRAGIIAACLAGVPEAEAARRAGVDRMTVRKWRGKN